MSISTRQELIEELKQGHPDEVLVYTYWDDTDFEAYADKEQAQDLINDALEASIGQANDYLVGHYDYPEEIGRAHV